MHGTAITKTDIVIADEPPSIERTGDGAKPGKATLQSADLDTLRPLLASDDFKALAKETPKPGPAHPGMRYCTLELASAAGHTSVRWTSADTFSAAGQATLQRIRSAIGELTKRLP